MYTLTEGKGLNLHQGARASGSGGRETPDSDPFWLFHSIKGLIDATLTSTAHVCGQGGRCWSGWGAASIVIHTGFQRSMLSSPSGMEHQVLHLI